MKRYVVIEESGHPFKIWDRKIEQMYLCQGESLVKMGLPLLSHVAFHPYANIYETDELPKMTWPIPTWTK